MLLSVKANGFIPMLIPSQVLMEGMSFMWKSIKGYEGLYEISENGEIRNAKGFIKKPKPDKDGYFKIWLSKNSKKRPYFIHRLVAVEFVENTYEKPIVNHIDGTKVNNHYSNLEWCTRSENDKHAFQLGLRKVTCGGTSKCVSQYDLNGNFITKYNSISHASRETDVPITSISNCINKKNKTAGGYIWEFIGKGVTTSRKT